ncbi:MAG: LPS export ABC transporter ATP-binding protein [Gemmatimonadales bacterium]
MNQLLASAEGRNPSLPLALAALLRVIDEQQGAAFSDLAVAYREDHLELHRRVLGDVPGGGGVLSLDEVRRFLQSSVLPRLVGEGLVRVPPGDLDDQARIALAVAVGDADRAPLRTELLERAADALRQAEAPPAPTLPAGAVLQGEHLTKRYNRRRVVDDVAVQLRQGEIVGLLGPNGAGKTTTFYMIVGLVRPDRGRIALDGADISHEPMYRRARMGIGYLAQEPSVFRKLTVEENVLAILETLEPNRAARRDRLEFLLDELSIKHLRTTPAYKLSGGERRRLEITRALVNAPRFMLLDEPFAGVDPIAVHDIQTIVAGLRHKGIGVLITDHNVEQTLDIVDRAYIMFDGKVQVGGTVRELVFNDRVADLYLGPTLTTRLRDRLGAR